MHLNVLNHRCRPLKVTPLEQPNHPIDKRDGPCNGVQYPQRCARARNIADLADNKQMPRQTPDLGVPLTVPKQILSFKNMARVIEPPNQNIIVTASRASRPYLVTGLLRR